jgi:hypothetical protein
MHARWDDGENSTPSVSFYLNGNLVKSDMFGTSAPESIKSSKFGGYP